jgi:hypothetical protein
VAQTQPKQTIFGTWNYPEVTGFSNSDSMYQLIVTQEDLTDAVAALKY